MSTWLDDPRLARRFARLTWVVLVTVFVLLLRLDLGAVAERAIGAALALVVVVLNAPVVVGLHKSRAEAHTTAYRLVALALVARLAATGWVLWMLAR